MYGLWCAAGYVGRHCETDVDECASTPCANNATCRDLVARYECRCLEEYYGDRCELKVDKCLLNNTCVNGGECVDEWLTKRCVCTPRYTGVDCEKGRRNAATDNTHTDWPVLPELTKTVHTQPLWHKRIHNNILINIIFIRNLISQRNITNGNMKKKKQNKI